MNKIKLGIGGVSRTQKGFTDSSESGVTEQPSGETEGHRLGEDCTARERIGTGNVLERFCDKKLAVDVRSVGTRSKPSCTIHPLDYTEPFRLSCNWRWPVFSRSISRSVESIEHESSNASVKPIKISSPEGRSGPRAFSPRRPRPPLVCATRDTFEAVGAKGVTTLEGLNGRREAGIAVVVNRTAQGHVSLSELTPIYGHFYARNHW